MTAAVVASAFASGWREVASADEVVERPLSDGGPGLAAALGSALPGAEQVWVDAPGPTGGPAGGPVLVHAGTAYVESALACGLHLLEAVAGDVRTATTYGVGRMVRVASARQDVQTVVVGLGGSGTSDGGAGLWAALGAEPSDLLAGGGVALRRLDAVSPPPPVGASLVAATDVDNPLLGLHGAAAVFGPQKGADRAAVMEFDAALERWSDLVEVVTGRPGLRDAPGAGAAGGLGFGLLALGAERRSGVELVIEAVGLAEQVAGADLVVTGEGRFDATSLRGKVVSGVARVGQENGVPVVVAAGQVEIGAREASAHGIDEVWSVTDLLGSVEAARSAGPDGVGALAAAIAKEWTRLR
jgi:glycerate kinase